MPTGLGTPGGGATSIFGSTSCFPSSSLGSCAGSAWNFGATLDANLWGTGLAHVGTGLGELSQSGIFGSLSAGGFKPLDVTGTSGTAPGGVGQMDMSAGGFKPIDVVGAPGTAPGGGVGQMDLSAGGFKPVTLDPQGTPGTAGGGAYRDDAMARLNEMLKGFNQPVPANNVANLVNRATQDPRLTGPVTQIANDAQGNKLLNGALDAGLRGIEVANLPAGFQGQYLPDLKQIQVAPTTVGGNDIVRTLAHELVHAATPGNGDSLNEENLADKIGTEIQRRLTGMGPGYVLGGNSYNGLPQDNGIGTALRLLGINF